MNDSNKTDRIDELMLAAFVDGQLDATHSEAIIDAMDNDPDMRQRVYELRKIKDLVKLGYEDAIPDAPRKNSFKPFPFWRQHCAGIAASIVAISVSFAAGVTYYHYNQSTPPFSSQDVASINLEQIDHIILHISESDPRLFEASLLFTEKFLKKHSHNARIEVVANAGGIDLMRSDYPLGDKVREMMADYDNVTFVACTNAINKLRQQGIVPKIIKDVGTDEAALDHILDRVREGWTYLKASDAEKLMI